jgi:hypothetical protein
MLDTGSNTVCYRLYTPFLSVHNMYRNKVKAVCLKIRCSLVSQFSANKRISREERKQCLKHTFIHFSDINSENSGRYINCFEVRTSVFCE